MKDECVKIELQCPFCHAIFSRSLRKQNNYPIQFCAYCGTGFSKDKKSSDSQATHIAEHLIEDDIEPIAHVGRYTLLKNIGKGGMGEVFLAYDEIAGRKIALKRIRTDLISSPILRKRFVREARITSQLIHPSIIPIFDIHIDKEIIYYTMPYVEGETLRSILKKLKVSEEQGVPFDPDIALYSSFQSLIPIFLDIAQAVAFAHSRGVLHRDLKPENVIIGKYGQVIILDWGLTKLFQEENNIDDEVMKDHPCKNEKNHLTKIGKLLGTITYMAPERAKGFPATVKTDIYALGVILYQILTLTVPFHRKSIEEFQKNLELEKYIPPDIRSPHRDIPRSLCQIVNRCLTKNASDRFEKVDDLISIIQSYLEGRSEWTENTTLSLNTKSDWSFEEHVLLSEHSAISTPIERAQWCRLVISKARFSDNVQISAKILLQEGQQGVGFLVGIPDEEKRHDILEGYCIWLGSQCDKETSPSKILRHGISILEIPEAVLIPDVAYDIRIERIEQTISIWINEKCVATKTSFLPVVGEYVGIMIKDAYPPLESISVASGSINILINRLMVPDAFLANMDFDHALLEYRKIAALFPGRYEGKEALFRSGITLLEKAEHASSFNIEIYNSALEEFSKLKNTSGAPLEYLGKSFVYHALGEYEEEVKCFELAFTRFVKHPLLPMISEYLIQRMHETAKSDRKAAYAFISLVVRKLPSEITQKESIQNLFYALEKSWEIPLYFLHTNNEENPSLYRASFCLILSFWLQKCYIAHEIFRELIQIPILPRVLIFQSCAILYLSCPSELQKCLTKWKYELSDDEQLEFNDLFSLFELLLELQTVDISDRIPSLLLNIQDTRMQSFLMDRCNFIGRYDLTLLMHKEKVDIHTAPSILEALFYNREITTSQQILLNFPGALLTSEDSPLYFWYGVLLAALGEHERMESHFQAILDTPNPKSWLLGVHVYIKKIYLTESNTGWLSRSFPYEREILLRQMRILQLYLKNSSLISSAIDLLQKYV